VLAAEHLLDFAGLDFLIERVESLDEIRVHVLARLRPLDEHAEIVALLSERANQFAILLQAAAPLQNLLSFDLVFPEIRRGGFRFELIQFLFGASGFKDSSADRRRAY
jgi:hypothetical protein